MDNFASQWLRLQSVKEADPDGGRLPELHAQPRPVDDARDELLFDSIVREDRSLLDLLTADYTFVDEVLAKHYGIPNVVGTAFRRVPVTDPNRFGLLGHSSVLTLTSLATRTSPVVRGKYVMEVLLGVAAAAAAGQRAAAGGERREREGAARCASAWRSIARTPPAPACHNMMDPIGLALENFDAIGRWRNTRRAARPWIRAGQLFDGTALDGPVSLRGALLESHRRVRRRPSPKTC